MGLRLKGGEATGKNTLEKTARVWYDTPSSWGKVPLTDCGCTFYAEGRRMARSEAENRIIPVFSE